MGARNPTQVPRRGPTVVNYIQRMSFRSGCDGTHLTVSLPKKLRQEDCEFVGSLGYIMNLTLV